MSSRARTVALNALVMFAGCFAFTLVVGAATGSTKLAASTGVAFAYALWRML